jgi:predicted NAD/FAD-binding protein
MTRTRKRVAIVGSGCSGLGALWALKNTDYEVHLFEADERLGGHTHTVTFKNGKNKYPVDTGFIVYNMAT